jgi:hypothetical protein
MVGWGSGLGSHGNCATPRPDNFACHPCEIGLVYLLSHIIKAECAKWLQQMKVKYRNTKPKTAAS